ncbi:hypothetical protein [Mesoflavibacter zeaxanthinifaciens]|uniref:hypothetical protein n=1 Tax=Mesoflavibacter zeaxanthinifaciens TaxID=393060 RepID=UPI003A8DA733
MSSIARNYNLGIELSEKALNKISASLYHFKPGLFETYEDILVEPNTGRTLSLYAFLDEPFAFNFYPIQNSELKEGGIYVEAALSFTLTDKKRGDETGTLITRIKMRLQAGLEIVQDSSVNEQKVNVFLDTLKFTQFTSDHPDGLINDRKKMLDKNHIVDSNDDLPTKDPSFIAILNYLIEVFLVKSLKKPLESFPFPPVHLIPERNLSLYLRAITTWGNCLGAYLKTESGGPQKIIGNPPVHGKDISIGITEETITRILNASLPVKSDLTPTPSNRTFNIRGGYVEIKERMLPSLPFRSNIELKAPNTIHATFFFNGRIDAQINVKLGKYWVRVPFTIPIGDRSFISGLFNLFVEEKDNEFSVNLRPEPNFFSTPTAIVIATNYKDLFKNEVEKWLDKHVSPVLKKIPIIGWIISVSVKTIVGRLLAYFAGSLLDGIVSTFLTGFLTIAYNLVRLLFNETLTFPVFEVKKELPNSEIPIKIKSLFDPRIDPNAGGELTILADFDEPPISSPEPPFPITPDSYYVELKEDNTPDNVLDNGLFIPHFKLPSLSWANEKHLSYELELTVDGVLYKSLQQVQYSNNETGNNVLLIETMLPDELGGKSVSKIIIDKSSNKVLEETQSSWAKTSSGLTEIKTSFFYDYANFLAKRILEFGDLNPDISEITIPQKALLIGSINGAYQLQGSFQEDTIGVLSRVDQEDDTESFQVIPIKTTSSKIYTITVNGQNIDVIDLIMEDSDFKSKSVFMAKSPFLLLNHVQEGLDTTVSMRLIH